MIYTHHKNVTKQESPADSSQLEYLNTSQPQRIPQLILSSLLGIAILHLGSCSTSGLDTWRNTMGPGIHESTTFSNNPGLVARWDEDGWRWMKMDEAGDQASFSFFSLKFFFAGVFATGLSFIK